MWLAVVAGGCVWDVMVVIFVAGGWWMWQLDVAGGCGWCMCLGRDGCDIVVGGWWMWQVDVTGGCGW